MIWLIFVHYLSIKLVFNLICATEIGYFTNYNIILNIL